MDEKITRRDMVIRAVQKVHRQVAASPMPALPIIFSEFNATYTGNEIDVTDSPYIGPWLANTIRACDGLLDSMSYWTFSDVFEEGGIAKSPFHGGFGLIAAGGIPRPRSTISDCSTAGRAAVGCFIRLRAGHAPPRRHAGNRRLELRASGARR